MFARSRRLLLPVCVTLLLVGVTGLGGFAEWDGPDPVRAVSRITEFDAGNGMHIGGYVALSRGLQKADGSAASVRVLAHYLVLHVDGTQKGGFSGVPLVNTNGREPYERAVFQLAGAPGQTPKPGALSFIVRLVIRPRAALTWGEVVSSDDLLVETTCTRDIGMTIPRR